jgi:hypothetical protein
LAGKALDLGLIKKDSTRGHLFQAIGAAQSFFADHPEAQAHIALAPVDDTPWHLEGADLEAWLEWFAPKEGTYGHHSFAYDYNVLYRVLTRKYGGRTTGGGGADNEFEIALRLVARYF